MRLNDDPRTEKPDIILDEATDISSWGIYLTDERVVLCMIFEQIDRRVLFPIKFSPSEDDFKAVNLIIATIAQLRNGDAE